MAAPKPAAKKSAAGGKTKKPGRKLSGLYSISGDKVSRKNKFCPKCGSGTFLGSHQNRLVCGKCRYTEFKKN